MPYHKTLDYLFSQLPMFQRTGAAAYKANLDNTYAICNLLGNPEHKFKSIHIAGTNGKGSTSHMLASILQEAGYKVGLYTSPHLIDFRERIKINGKMISKNAVTNFVRKYQKDFDRIQPSFFEMTVGLAFDYFVKQKVDVAVIETGLGGRLDSTNVINPLLSVITNISIDHTNLLGDTIAKIAAEKAGIIKENTPVVIGETQNDAKEIFIRKAKECNTPISFADKSFKVNAIESNRDYQFDIISNKKFYLKGLKCQLKGFYQQKNILTVLQACELLKTEFSLKKKHIESGIKNVIDNTGLLGRWQKLSDNPLTICDTGHNEAGICEILKQISKTSHKQLHFVIGMVNDKEIEKILKMLPKKAIYYFCKADIPRALDAELLKEKAFKAGLKGQTYWSVKNALKAAQKNAADNDLVFVGGSTFVVAEVV